MLVVLLLLLAQAVPAASKMGRMIWEIMIMMVVERN